MNALEQRRANLEAIATRRRAATHCKNGHEFTPENTLRRCDGRRECRLCANDRKAYYFQHLRRLAQVGREALR